MIMNCDQYTGKCVCGHEHTLETKMVVVEYNALANFEKYMEAVGLANISPATRRSCWMPTASARKTF